MSFARITPTQVNDVFFFLDFISQTQSSTTLSSHDEWEPEMSTLDRVNAIIHLISDGSIPLLRLVKMSKEGDTQTNIK